MDCPIFLWAVAFRATFTSMNGSGSGFPGVNWLLVEVPCRIPSPPSRYNGICVLMVVIKDIFSSQSWLAVYSIIQFDMAVPRHIEEKWFSTPHLWQDLPLAGHCLPPLG